MKQTNQLVNNAIGGHNEDGTPLRNYLLYALCFVEKKKCELTNSPSFLSLSLYSACPLLSQFGMAYLKTSSISDELVSKVIDVERIELWIRWVGSNDNKVGSEPCQDGLLSL